VFTSFASLVSSFRDIGRGGNGNNGNTRKTSVFRKAPNAQGNSEVFTSSTRLFPSRKQQRKQETAMSKNCPSCHRPTDKSSACWKCGVRLCWRCGQSTGIVFCLTCQACAAWLDAWYGDEWEPERQCEDEAINRTAV
jgi:hypothetical protein